MVVDCRRTLWAVADSPADLGASFQYLQSSVCRRLRTVREHAAVELLINMRGHRRPRTKTDCVECPIVIMKERVRLDFSATIAAESTFGFGKKATYQILRICTPSGYVRAHVLAETSISAGKFNDFLCSIILEYVFTRLSA
jgi:hypothetical protein